MTDPMATRAAEAVRRARRPCDYCELPIVWTTTEQGNAMPVDADDTVGGNLLLTADAGGKVRSAVVAQEGRRATYRRVGYTLHVHHKLSCPHADEWSRPGGPRRGSYRSRTAAPVRRGAGQPAGRRGR